ncbi:hypothetical protein D3C81_1114700 [compost metagenome]
MFDFRFQGAVKLKQLRLGISSRGDIDGRADQPDDLACFVAQGGFDRKPVGSRAIRHVDTLFDLQRAFPAMHDMTIGFHDLACLGLVFQKLQVGFAQVQFWWFTNQSSDTVICNNQPPLEILCVDNTRNGSREGTQQR